MCSPLAGRTFCGRVLGVYGNALSSTQTKGAHWEDQHGSIVRLFVFVAQANENGLLAADYYYYEPSGAFIGVIPRAQRHAFYALRKSTQHSTTPDVRVQLAPGDDAYYDYDARAVHVNKRRAPLLPPQPPATDANGRLWRFNRQTENQERPPRKTTGRVRKRPP